MEKMYKRLSEFEREGYPMAPDSGGIAKVMQLGGGTFFTAHNGGGLPSTLRGLTLVNNYGDQRVELWNFNDEGLEVGDAVLVNEEGDVESVTRKTANRIYGVVVGMTKWVKAKCGNHHLVSGSVEYVDETCYKLYKLKE